MNSFVLPLALALLGLASAQVQTPNDPSIFVIDTNEVYTEEKTTGQAIALPVIGSLALVLLIAPFIVQARGGNIGQCSQFFWISLANLFTVTNAIIWPNFNWMTWYDGHGYCDIQAKLFFPTFTGVACATVCITRRLAMAIDPDKMRVSQTKRQKLRTTLEDLFICFFIPLIQIALHYVVQYGRYYITAVGGCLASYDNSWPTLVVMYVWPLIFSLVNCYYSVLIIYRLRQYRHQVAKLLGNNHKNLAMFLRLFGNSLLLVLIYTPVIVYFTTISVNIEWVSPNFTLTHTPEAMSGILYYPDLGPRTFDRWTNIVMTFFIFLFFGTGTHAIETYRGWLVMIGAGKIWPGLNEPGRRRQGSVDTRTSSMASKWSLISRARRYFENLSRSTQATSSGGIDTYDSRDEFGLSSRKSSLLPQHIQHIPNSGRSKTSTNNPPPLQSMTFNDAAAIPLNAPTGHRFPSTSHHGFPATTHASAWVAKKLSPKPSSKAAPTSSIPVKAPSITYPAPIRTSGTIGVASSMPNRTFGFESHRAAANNLDSETQPGRQIQDNTVETKVWTGSDKERSGSVAPEIGVKVKKSVERNVEGGLM